MLDIILNSFESYPELHKIILINLEQLIFGMNFCFIDNVRFFRDFCQSNISNNLFRVFDFSCSFF